jgi:hypothetical protein
MLTLNGIVLNVYDTPASTDKKTGEVRSAASRVQIHAKNILENGQVKFEMVTLKVQDGEAYKKLTGKPVSVPVGAFIANGAILYYALKETPLAHV